MRKSQPIGAIDDDGIGRGNVDAAFDDRRADEHVEAAMIEVEHDPLQRAFAHLSVGDTDVGLRQETHEVRRDRLDVLDPVVHEVNLAAAAQLPQHGFANRLPVPLAHERLHREPGLRRRADK